MKLLCLNICKGKYLKEVLKYIRENDFDFIALQEVLNSNSIEGELIYKNEKSLNSLDYLKRNLVGYEVYYSPSLESTVEGYSVQYGNAIFSKFAIVSIETRFIHEKFDPQFIYPPEGVSFDNEPRCLQKIKIRYKNQNLEIINLHGIFQLDSYKGDSPKAMKMIDKIINVYEKNIPTIICGDFNLLPKTNAIGQMDKILRNLTTESKILSTKSSLSQSQNIIDYIFTNHPVKIERFDVVDIIISDHKPLVVQFSLN